MPGEPTEDCEICDDPIDMTWDRWRVTLRSGTVELRGYVISMDSVTALARAIEPLGIMVIGSPADADYDPFTDED